jgi:hypothetical protein
MPTADRLSPTAVLRQLQTQGKRLQGSIMAQRPILRWSLAMAGCTLVIGLTTIGYWAVSSLSAVDVQHLLSGKRFSSDDLIKVCRALDRQRVAYRVDEERRVQVSAYQFDQAAELVAKLDLGQHSIDEIREGPNTWQGLFEPPNERDRKKHLAREKILECLINQLDGVGWSLVSINRPHGSGWVRPSATPSAFVYIETVRNHHLPYQSIQAIPKIVASYENDLPLAAITVMDRWGTSYFDAGNLAVGDHWRKRAREEELAAEIMKALNWIKGVRVQVQVFTDGSAAPISAVAGFSPTPIAAQTPASRTAARPENATGTGSPLVGSRTVIAVNQPLALYPNPEPQSSAKPSLSFGGESSVSASGIPVDPEVADLSAIARNDQRQERGRVLIYMPRSFYYRADMHNPGRDELLVMRDRIERQIHTAVGLIISDADSWTVDIDIIPDEVSHTQSAVSPSPADPRPRVLDWGIVAAVVAAVSLLAAVSAWIHAVRRPLRISEPALNSPRYHVNYASDRGPAERVRELVRRNPESAACVLQRWARAGGQAS